jgi:molybdate transport system substrate-binding protein
LGKKRFFRIGLIVLAAIGLNSGCSSGEKALLIYAGAGMKDPMNEIAKGFKNEYGVKVTYIYGGSGVLFSQLNTQRLGDVFLPGSELHMEIASQKGYLDSYRPVVKHIPIIMVAPGNPKDIHSLGDLTKEGVRVSLGRENACAICKLTPLILKKADIYAGVVANAVTESRTTVSEICLDVTTGQADAAVVWRSSAYKYGKQGKAETIDIAEKYNIIETIPIGILKFTRDRDNAERFTDYAISRKDVWTKWGYELVD